MKKNTIVEKIIDSVKKDSTYLMEKKSDYNALAICADVSTDFYLFLRKNKKIDAIKHGDVDYMNGTIRSGIDWFFDFLFVSKIAEDKNLSLGWMDCKSYSELRKNFLKEFESILSDYSARSSKLQIFLKLIRYQLIFLGNTFDHETIKLILDRFNSPRKIKIKVPKLSDEDKKTVEKYLKIGKFRPRHLSKLKSFLKTTRSVK